METLSYTTQYLMYRVKVVYLQIAGKMGYNRTVCLCIGVFNAVTKSLSYLQASLSVVIKYEQTNQTAF